MSSVFKSSGFRLAFAIALSAGALALAVRSANIAGLRAALTGARFSWLVAYPVLCIVLNLVRGDIWRRLLRGRVSTLEAFWAYSVGFVANNVLPFRVGEAARVVVLSTHNHVPIVEAAASAGLERLLDLVMLSLMLAMLGPAMTHVPGLGGGAPAVAVLVGVAVLAIVVIARHREQLPATVARAAVWLPAGTRAAIVERSRQLANSLSVALQPSIAIPAVAGSALVWILTVVLQWLVLRSFQPHAGATDAAFMVAVVSLASALPSAPGFVGVYHWAGQLSLMAAFPDRYDASTALAAATVAHAASYITSTGLGLIGLWHFGMSPAAVAGVVADRGAPPRGAGEGAAPSHVSEPGLTEGMTHL